MLTPLKYLTPSEVVNLTKMLHQSPGRDALLIEFALRTGARGCEIRGLRPEDLFLESASVFIRGAKGSNDRNIPLPKTFIKKLIGLVKTEDQERVFPISEQRVRQIWDFWRPHPRKGFHCLRHTFAIKLYNRTRDIRMVKYALGHKNIKNTMIYQDYAYSQNELRKALV